LGSQATRIFASAALKQKDQAEFMMLKPQAGATRTRDIVVAAHMVRELTN
jgi:hypothetical protein